MYEYDSKNEEERSDDDINYMEALNMSANESKDFDHRNKYLLPLPSTSNNSKKKNKTYNEKNIQEIKFNQNIHEDIFNEKIFQD